ncbi:FecR family protein [Dyella acidiphila]|uniref:FecR domain-containing protein n=1 Tax=Dyella acidiphila TaxID=2775866 RepID=A0ABR9G9M5_9GAMM|nr:FecR domain-containing protein [Dyella acidiphila]MBE1160742.1 FecR domain-containing protein [Dyella acidiphila]
MNKHANFEARRHARRISEQAVAWYLEQQDHPSDRQQQAFLAWLRTSPAHVAEYLAVAQMHGDLKVAASMDTLSVMELAHRVKHESPVVMFPQLGAGPHAKETGRAARARPFALRIAAAAAVLLLMVASGMYWRGAGTAFHQRYMADATVKALDLPDGSLVQLDQHSVIEVQFDRHLRRIAVVSGHALFDVGKDPQRPLLVTVGGHVLQDIGTVFDVRHDAGGDTLTVISGRVRVWNAPKAWLADMQDFVGVPATGNHAIADLGAGQQIKLDPATDATAVQPAVLARTTAWLPTEIRFQHETVGEVARRFNAYTTTPLVIEDTQIAKLRISGVFHADNPEAFLAYLSSLPGVRVMQGHDRVRVMAAAEPPAGPHAL